VLPSVEVAQEVEAKSTLEPKQPKPAKVVVAPAASTPTSLKRIRQPVVSDYNTRHRDKRVRVSDPGPGSSRRKTMRRVNEATVYTPKKTKAAQKVETPSKPGRRTVFDGVVLPRFFPSADKGKEKEQADTVVTNGAPPEEQEEQEADGEEKGEEGSAPDGVDSVLEGLEDSRVESSLASSNKGSSFESSY
jgi:hypothetical protein